MIIIIIAKYISGLFDSLGESTLIVLQNHIAA